MATVREIIASVRAYLGMPAYEKLDNGTICMHLYDQIDYQLTRLKMTDENWMIDRKIISVSPDNDEYILPPNFGRSILVETVDDGTSYYVRREVTVVDVQDWNLYWAGYRTRLGTEYYSHVAEVCAFFGSETGQRTIKFAPQQNLTADYRVWYEIGKTANPALNSEPALFKQFHNLLKVGTAMACLPNCGYPAEQAEGFRDTLTMLLTQFDEVFDRYIHQGHHEDTGPRRAFNSSRQYGSFEW